MKKFLTTNFLSLLAIALFAVIIIQRCGHTTSTPPPKIVTTTQIIEHTHDSIVYRDRPAITSVVKPSKKDIPVKMLPDSNYAKLKIQYDSLLDAHYTKNVILDSLKIDSIGYVSTLDTLQENRILSRKWAYNIKEREKITNTTITKYAPYKNQIYIGGGLLGNENKLVSGVTLGAFLKNKNDQVYKIGVQKIVNLPITYELSTYYKLKFHK